MANKHLFNPARPRYMSAMQCAPLLPALMIAAIGGGAMARARRG